MPSNRKLTNNQIRLEIAQLHVKISEIGIKYEKKANKVAQPYRCKIYWLYKELDRRRDKGIEEPLG